MGRGGGGEGIREEVMGENNIMGDKKRNFKRVRGGYQKERDDRRGAEGMGWEEEMERNEERKGKMSFSLIIPDHPKPSFLKYQFFRARQSFQILRVSE